VHIGSSGTKLKGPDTVTTKVYFNKATTMWDRVLVMTPDEAKWRTCAIIPSLDAKFASGDDLSVSLLLGFPKIQDGQQLIFAQWAIDDSTRERGLLVQYAGIHTGADGFWLTIFC
jgi:hypothetical protein